MILKTGVQYHYFELNGILRQCGHFDYVIEDGKLIIWDKMTANKFSPVSSAPLASVLNGDSGNAAFANEAAIKTWLAANFFF